MALSLPVPDDAGGAAWEQEWRPYDDYLNVHYSRIRRLEAEGLVVEDRLSILPVASPNERWPDRLRILGRLRCQDDVSIRVDKTLTVRYVRGMPQVRAIRYSYHAWIGASEQDILRYDMAHGEGLHCHVFDLVTGETALLPVSLDMLPSLDGFVRMACRQAADAAAGHGASGEP